MQAMQVLHVRLIDTNKNHAKHKIDDVEVKGFCLLK